MVSDVLAPNRRLLWTEEGGVCFVTPKCEALTPP